MTKLIMEQMSEKIALLSKNEKALGEKIKEPKYEKAYNKLCCEAWDLVKQHLQETVCRMYYRPKLDDGKLGKERNKIALASIPSLRRAFAQRNIQQIEEIINKAGMKALDAWSEYFPILNKNGGVL